MFFAECAQRLIDACDRIIKAKPDWASNSRATATVVLPDMFNSEVCIYFQEEYFQSHTSPNEQKGDLEYYEQKKIADKSLCQEWGLSLTRNIQELGIKTIYINSTNPEEDVIRECWYFGEVF